VEDGMDKVALTYQRFKEIQLNHHADMESFKQAKTELNNRLKELNDTLNRRLHSTQSALKYEDWLASHQPFHWLAEFYQIIKGNGGFDVIVGNPPYVVYRKKDKVTKKSVSDLYSLKAYDTIECNNLYAFVIERSLRVVKNRDNIGMIVPLTIASNNNMSTLRDFMTSKGTVYYSHYEIRPARLFDGVEQRLTIFIIRNTAINSIKTTSIIRWNSEFRNILFSQLYYVDTFNNGSIWRLSTNIETSIYNKYIVHNTSMNYLSSLPNQKRKISYRTAGVRYWIIFLLNGFNSESLSNKDAYFIEDNQAEFFMSAFNSNLFWWYYATNFDMFNLKDYMIFNFKLTYTFDEKLKNLANELELDLDSNKTELTTNSITRGEVNSYVYKKKQSKPIIDEIDKVLAEHYGFTDEELDFIINYDIKYRMGKELEGEE